MFEFCVRWFAWGFDTSLKAALVALVAAAVLKLLRMHDSNIRHRVWTGVLAGMLLLPVLTPLMPALRLPLVPSPEMLVAWTAEPNVADVPLATESHELRTVSSPAPPEAVAITESQPNHPLSPIGDRRQFPPVHFSPPGSFPSPEMANQNRPSPATEPAGPPALASLPPPPAPHSAPSRRAIAAAFALFVGGVWFVISAILSLRLTIGLWMASRVRRASLLIDSADLAKTNASVAIIRECPTISVPLTVGWLRPRILLPPEWRHWSTDKLHAVLAHEQMHVQRADCLVALIAELNCCLYWFHPLAWWLKQQLSSLAEQACDDAAIDSTGDRARYARHLLEVAAAVSQQRGRLVPAGVSMARRSNVETRIHAILDFTRPLSRRLTWRSTLVLLAVMGPLIVLAAALKPSAGQQRENVGSAGGSKKEVEQASQKQEDTSVKSNAPQGAAEAAEPTNASPGPPITEVPFTFTGTTVDDRGQPVAGATISLGYWEDMPKGPGWRALAVSDEQGKFTFTTKISGLATPKHPRLWSGAKLIAAKDGYGFGIGPLPYFEMSGRLTTELKEREREIIEYSFGKSMTALTLATDDVPIRGRLVNSEGQPVAGARVDVTGIWSGVDGSLDKWEVTAAEANASDRAAAKHLKQISQAGTSVITGNFSAPHGLVVPPMQTDAEGRFTLRGVGREHVVTLYLSGSGIATTPVHVRTRAGDVLRLIEYPDRPARGSVVYHPAEFTIAAGPSVPVEGRVTDKRTGKPLSGMLVQGYKVSTDEVRGGQEATAIHTTTGDDGSYRLEGLPLGHNKFRIMPPRDSAYLVSEVDVSLSAGASPPQRDVAISTGVRLHGRVTDSLTGKDIAGSLTYFAFETNPELKANPGFDSPAWGHHTDAEGNYALPVLPGPGILAFNADEASRYPRGVGADKIDGPKTVTNGIFFNTVPYQLMAINFHLLTGLNPPADAEEVTVDLTLTPGKSLTGRVLDPSGQPMEDFYLLGHRWGGWTHHRGASFEIKGYVASEGRRITAYDPARNLVGRIDLAGETPEQIEIALREGGTLVGRVVDAAGLPIEGLSIGSALENWKPGMMGPTTAQKAQGSLITHLENAPTLTDKNGRFELTGILPGPKYSGGVTGPQRSEGRSYMSYLGYIFKDTTIEPGQTKDLGDLQIKPEWDEEEKEEQAQKPEAKANENNPPPPANAEPAKVEPAKAAPAASDPRTTPLRGRVLSAGGKAVAGAKIYWFWSRTPDLTPMKPRLLATTNASGQFNFTLPAIADQTERLAWTSRDYLVVIAPGHGFAETSPAELRNLVAVTPAKGMFGNLIQAFAGDPVPTIRLPAAGEPIRGRLVNIDGQPVAGATVKVCWFDDIRPVSTWNLNATDDDEKAAWPERVSSLLHSIEPIQLRDALPSAKTDAAGRFELRDIGANRLFQLLVRSDNTETVDLAVRNQSGQPITIAANPRSGGAATILHAREFTYALGPSKPLTGRVLDLDSGEPISGAVVRAYKIHGNEMHSLRDREEFSATTDSQGRYRLTGLPVGAENRLLAFATGDVPYIPIGHPIDTTKGDSIQQDFRLKRGVWATGRVYDAATNEPFTGEIRYYWFRNKELEKQIPGLFYAWVDWLYWTDNNGEFRLPVLPSRGILAFRYSGRIASDQDGMNRFPRGAGADAITGSEKMGSMPAFPTLPHYLTPANYQRLAEVNPTPGQETIRVDLPLVASQPFQIRVVDADGKPVAGCEVHGASERWGWQDIASAEFPIEDMQAGERRKVLAFHRDRGLAGGVIVKHGDPQPVEIKLAPAGTLTGRLVDADGQPINDVTLLDDLEKFDDDDQAAVWADDPNIRIQPSDIPVDENGRFHLSGLIPGWTYTAHASAHRKFDGETMNRIIGSAFQNIRLQPGEKKDLGDLRIKPESDEEEKEEQEQKPQAKANEKSPPPPANADPAQAAAAADNLTFTYAGSVVDPSGKPVAGAKLHLCYFTREPAPDLSPVSVTDANGQFRFSRHRQDFDQRAENGAAWRAASIVATADGFGFARGVSAIFETTGALIAELPEGWNKRLEEHYGPQSNILKLVPDKPIKARVVNIDGRPVVGAKLEFQYIWGSKDGSLAAWEQGASQPRASAFELQRSLDTLVNGPRAAAIVQSTLSDRDGWLTVKGLGNERLATVQITGPGIESKIFKVRSRPGQTLQLSLNPQREETGRETYYPSSFTHIAGPSQPIIGQVTDANSGKPVPGCVVQGDLMASQTGGPSFFVTGQLKTSTDAEGRFRLEGLPPSEKLPRNFANLLVLPPRVSALLPGAVSIATGTAADPLTRDVKLYTGIRIRGTVLDGRTGKPVLGSLSYVPADNNPAAKSAAGVQEARLDHYYYQTNFAGRFEIPVLPGKGILSFTANNWPDYPLGVGLEDAKTISKTIAFRAQSANLLTQIDLPEGTEEKIVSLTLGSGETIRGSVLTPEGKPLEKYAYSGATSVSGWQMARGQEFEVNGYFPAIGRQLMFWEPERNLVALRQLTGLPPAKLEVKLIPGAKIKGRIVDEDGLPLENFVLIDNPQTVSSPADFRRVEDPTRGILVSSMQSQSVSTDKEGRFELPGIIPGLKYSAAVLGPGKLGSKTITAVLGTIFDDITAEPGQTKDLGDLKPNRDKPGLRPELKSETKAPSAPSVPASVTGTVLLPTGQPAASAHVAVVAFPNKPRQGGDLSRNGEVLAEGKTDDAGSFQLQLNGVSSTSHKYANLIARQDGSGIAWQKLNLDMPEATATLKLLPEEPIRGRLIDLEGQPASKINVRIRAIVKRTTGEWSEEGVGYDGETLPAAWLAPLVTDQEGRFVIHGIPSEHGVVINVAAIDRFAPQDIYLNTGMPEERGERDGTYRSLIRNAKPGDEIVLPLSPSQVFEGTIRYDDTKEPVPHARVTIWASQQRVGGSMTSVEGKTDATGRYRIAPRPGIRFGIKAYPPNGAAYLVRQTTDDIRWDNADRTKQVDLSLPPGVLIRGNVLTAGTKEPVAGASIQFIPQSTASRPLPKGIVTGWQGIQVSEKDGSYQIAIPPVPGHLLVNHDTGSYILQEIGSKFLNSGKPGGQRNYAHAIEKIDPAPDAKSLDLTIELQPGAIASGRIVDPQGQPVDNAVVVSRLHIWSHWLTWHGNTERWPAAPGRFELKGLKQGVEYPTHFLDPKRRLGATLNLKAGENEPTIVLEPCGSATARFLDDKGQPLADIHPNFDIIITPGVHRYDFEAQQAGQLAADSDFVANVDRTNHGDLKTDADGKLTIPALIPGATYAIKTLDNRRWEYVKEFQVRPGQTLDLGDIVIPKSSAQ